MIFKKHKKSIKDYAEYETIIESLLQKDNNNQIVTSSSENSHLSTTPSKPFSKIKLNLEKPTIVFQN